MPVIDSIATTSGYGRNVVREVRMASYSLDSKRKLLRNVKPRTDLHTRVIYCRAIAKCNRQLDNSSDPYIDCTGLQSNNATGTCLPTQQYTEENMKKHMRIILSVIAIIVVGIAVLLTVFKSTS
jgi:hypothetical protein